MAKKDKAEKPERKPYDAEQDIVVAEEPLVEKYVARVMRYDGGEEPGTPKLVVYKVGSKGKAFTPNRIPEDVAVALSKAIPKLVKAGAFK